MAEPAYLDVFGHEDLKARLARAAENRRLGQSILLHGHRGVGKQRLALWIAALINCPGPGSRPCGACRSCRLAGRLQHPDVHWFFPLPRPKGASGPDRLRKKLEDQRAAELEERRANPLYLDDEEGATGIYVAAAQVMRQLAYKAPAMGPAKVLVIGRAEALVPQAANPEAANALLKLLEEPPADTWIVLTSDVPGALLPTIRSRVQAVRVPPMPTEQVAAFLSDRLDLAPAEAHRLARLSGGSIGVALELQDADQDESRSFASDLVRALLDGRSAARLAAAHRFRSTGARGNFARILGVTRGILRDLLAISTGAPASDPEAVGSLARGRPLDPETLVAALDAIEDARELADRNINPQLIVVNFLRRASVTTGVPAGRHAG
ncbi:MAG: hypothetical protein GWN99_12535 [Gemmatimonadetes bacterium]|uniref:DNA-directed DNA polymerase n=1 Tax=Candidatus Kutchimonas denitrificans TaxID=3056748 RepID=A0AAE5CC99_9BACT|nr:hypothetical protein [Gemmatimonadota bacterium]NIR75558.1 hypothetical protein [Candidatus Kutchimonas denitrificans]NIS01872.1 hypothetical protein [Gemmatimonadota bacterium]NIT67653.1 hypothetical protein [Gemmatimonadota bacterium]NIU53527.1 hypothetical protein [Gemmatimonadota bacterium]